MDSSNPVESLSSPKQNKITTYIYKKKNQQK